MQHLGTCLGDPSFHLGVLEPNGNWTKGKCPCCGYNPTNAKRKADIAKFNLLTDEELKQNTT